jgi:tetratricopeptide (TPR) repeat protein
MSVRRLSLLLAMIVLAGCCVDPTVPSSPLSPLRLPTRIPTTVTPAPVGAQVYYEAGLACRQRGDVTCAMQYFDWAIEVDPEFAPAYVARGSVYLAQERLILALDDADRAIAADPDAASAYALRGEVLRLLGFYTQASQAFEQAVGLDPTLEEDLFSSRWLAACASDDSGRLLVLSRDYFENHPGDPLRYYYRGWAFISSGHSELAIHLLIEGIEGSSDPPALLWFALGYAYMDNNSWQEAVISLETAGELIRAGDTSLEIHSERPLVDFFGAMGRAYLGVGRCADAEMMIEHAIALGAPASEYAALLRESRLCMTPTPTPTPYPTTTPSFD